jgi:hypothetical protein
MGVSEHDVLLALANGGLISIQRSPPNAPTESGIPAFLAHERVRGAPLSRVLAAFRDPQNGGRGNLDAVQAYMFLIGRNECLDGFSPIEVLTGVADIAPEHLEALSFFAQDRAKRVEFIAHLATAWEAKARGW